MYGLGKNGYTWIYSAFSLFLVLACLTHSTEGGALRSKKFGKIFIIHSALSSPVSSLLMHLNDPKPVQ